MLRWREEEASDVRANQRRVAGAYCRTGKAVRSEEKRKAGVQDRREGGRERLRVGAVSRDSVLRAVDKVARCLRGPAGFSGREQEPVEAQEGNVKVFVGRFPDATVGAPAGSAGHDGPQGAAGHTDILLLNAPKLCCSSSILKWKRGMSRWVVKVL